MKSPCKHCHDRQRWAEYVDDSTGRSWRLRYKCQVCGKGAHDPAPEDLVNAYRDAKRAAQ